MVEPSVVISLVAGSFVIGGSVVAFFTTRFVTKTEHKQYTNELFERFEKNVDKALADINKKYDMVLADSKERYGTVLADSEKRYDTLWKRQDAFQDLITGGHYTFDVSLKSKEERATCGREP